MGYIKADNLVKHYGTGDALVQAVRGISFEIEESEFVAVMGESGSGKSTLLAMMGALNTPTSGLFTVDDIDIYNLSRDQRADFRREYLGFVFQSFNLIPYLTLAENVMLPLVTIKAPKKEKRRMAEEALARVGLKGKEYRLPSQVSGGEAERVAVARAIVNEPPILLADEPTGNLDSRTSGDIMGLLNKLNAEGMTIIMVTHSMESARNARRILMIADGHLVEEERIISETVTVKSAAAQATA
ncbi:MAG: ABC transporter ATP-binding protein [bacterium]|nr:ABC transporter ATP-binding protein [bacterium]MDT8396442.1 ABC transporter ATP-binding protein [bacterium]